MVPLPISLNDTAARNVVQIPVVVVVLVHVNGGVGKDQKEKSDWFETAEDVITLKDPDTCATPDEIGITASNAKQVFNANRTDWMTATLQDGTVVIAKKNRRITYQGRQYEKGPQKNSRWLRTD